MNISAMTGSARWRRWMPWVGSAAGVAALAWVPRGFDLGRFLGVLATADARFVALVPLAIDNITLGVATPSGITECGWQRLEHGLGWPAALDAMLNKIGGEH